MSHREEPRHKPNTSTHHPLFLFFGLILLLPSTRLNGCSKHRTTTFIASSSSSSPGHHQKILWAFLFFLLWWWLFSVTHTNTSELFLVFNLLAYQAKKARKKSLQVPVSLGKSCCCRSSHILSALLLLYLLSNTKYGQHQLYRFVTTITITSCLFIT